MYMRYSNRQLFIASLTLILFSINCTLIFKPYVIFKTKCEFHFSNQQEAEQARQWHEECPRVGGGPQGVVLTLIPSDRFGNNVFEYLSVWSMARRYNVWPAVPKLVLQTLNEGAFTSLVIPSLEDLTKRCNLLYLLEDIRNISDAGNVDDLVEALKFENGKRVSIIVLRQYNISTNYLIPYWMDLSNKLMFQNQYLVSSQIELYKITEDWRKQAMINDPEGITPTSDDIEYVAVHVRRTDYMRYLNKTFGSGTKPATSVFFIRAMKEMRHRLKSKEIIFVVVSDDLKWCQKNLQGPDIIIAGNGDVSSPGHDLALLAACNHTIMAYGTFGLTVAMFNKNGLTITYNTTSDKGATSVMSIASQLPNWIVL